MRDELIHPYRPIREEEEYQDFMESLKGNRFDYDSLSEDEDVIGCISENTEEETEEEYVYNNQRE